MKNAALAISIQTVPFEKNHSVYIYPESEAHFHMKSARRSVYSQRPYPRGLYRLPFLLHQVFALFLGMDAA